MIERARGVLAGIVAIIDDFEAKLINSSFMFSMVVYYISLPVFKNFFTAGLALLQGEARCEKVCCVGGGDGVC